MIQTQQAPAEPVAAWGYEYVTDEDGRRIAVDTRTGEAVQAVLFEAPIGSAVDTPRSRAQRANRKKYIPTRQNEKFYFTRADEQFLRLPSEVVARLIYLNTYIDFGNNKLMLTERTPMKRRDLPEVLHVSPATACRFWKVVSPDYIVEKDGGLLFTNKNVFVRDRLRDKAFVRYQKFFFDGVRSLYRSTNAEEHKRLGDIFKLLPFINIKYNVVCKPESVEEKDVDRIELLSVQEFCELVGCDMAHAYRLESRYGSIRFKVSKGRTERFCAFVYDGTEQDAKIIINPRVFYCGEDKAKTEILRLFFRE